MISNAWKPRPTTQLVPQHYMVSYIVPLSNICWLTMRAFTYQYKIKAWSYGARFANREFKHYHDSHQEWTTKRYYSLVILWTVLLRIYQKLVWPCWCIGWFDTVRFQVCFQLYVPVFSLSWFGYRYLWHCTLVSSTPQPYSQSDCFSVYVVLVLNVIRYSCHYFIDRILFHHDFHHDSCDYHCDFYGH